MPPPGPNGAVDASSAPDFIAVAGQGPGIVGYARRQDVLSPSDKAFPVYADDLRTVVGQMVPGKGFVPVGVDPNAVPRIPVVVGPATPHPPDGSKVVVYVRNDSANMIWDGVLIDGTITEDGGYWAQSSGAGCYAMPVGSQLVIYDPSISDPGAKILRVLYTRGSEAEATQLWFAASSSGTITQGVGVPPWWGSPQGC
jgi:hypothetical protein